MLTRRPVMMDAALLVLTIAIFGLLVAVLRGAERL